MKHTLQAVSVRKKWIIPVLASCTLFYFACVDSGNNNNNEAPKEELFEGAPVQVSFGPIPPTDISNPADPKEAAIFAWQEFIALTWPAKVNTTPGMSGYYRTQPSMTDSSGSTGSGGVVVWETFYHRAELFPSYMSGAGNKLPNPDTIPYYNYGYTTVYPVNGAKQNLFNNLDEASEITLAYMYYTPLAEKADALQKSISGTPTPAQLAALTDAQVKAGLVYEAKGNGVYYQYLDSTGYNNAVPRRKAKANNISLITNAMPAPTGPFFTLPSGTTEIKATWRHYDASADNLDDFHWTVGIYYTTDATQKIYASNDTFLLVGLHIIQKTPNVPTFTFATFEHVSNEKNGFRYINTNPGVVTGVLPRALPDSFLRTAIRQFPIPDAKAKFNLVAFNSAVQNQVRRQYGKKNVWANYQLIGVQAVVQDDPGGVVPDQQFFLSNFATETNDALQFFQGGLSGPDNNVPNPNVGHVFVFNTDSARYVGHTAGGCLGCHGSQGQFAGGDFSVIAATGNAFSPEPVTPYPGGSVYNQNPSGFPLPHSVAMPGPSNKELFFNPKTGKKKTGLE